MNSILLVLVSLAVLLGQGSGKRKPDSYEYRVYEEVHEEHEQHDHQDHEDQQDHQEHDNSHCPLACPPRWNTWGPFGETCYLMPSQPLHSNTFWHQQEYCKSIEPTSNILVINGLLEQALASAVSLQYAPSWASQLSNIYWWLGGYTDTNGEWHFVDGSDQTSNPLMTLAQIAPIVGGSRNNTCVGAEAKTLGAWQTYNCNEKTGAVICEMKKRNVCGETGGMLPISPLDLSPSKIKDLFPKAPSIPFISGFMKKNPLEKVVNPITGGLGGGVRDSLSGLTGGIFGKKK